MDAHEPKKQKRENEEKRMDEEEGERVTEGVSKGEKE